MLTAFVVSDRLWSVIQWPVIVVGVLFVVGFYGALLYGMSRLIRHLWKRLPHPEVVAFGLWIVTIFAFSFASTLVIVHRGAALQRPAQLSTHFLVLWAAASVGSMLLVSVIAGAVVFGRTTPWDIVLTWPWLVGLAVGLAWFLGLTGQMDGSSKLCDAPANGSCDTAWGLGAVLLAAVAAVVFGGAFISTASLKRLLLRTTGERPTT